VAHSLNKASDVSQPPSWRIPDRVLQELHGAANPLRIGSHRPAGDDIETIRAPSAKRKIRFSPKIGQQDQYAKDLPENWGETRRHLVLQGQKTAENGKIKAAWFVVSGSGTVNFPGFGAKEVLKATLEKGLTDGRIIGWIEAVCDRKDNAD
jgi:hypothetical protein